MKVRSLIAVLALVSSLNALAFEVTVLPTIESNTTISGVTGTVTHLKEQMVAVQGDAMNFLAGDAATETLLSVIDEVKKSSVEFQDLSDEEVAAIILQ